MRNVSNRFNIRDKVKINDSLINVVELLKTDFQINNKKFKTIGFFRKSPCHYLMLLNIAESSINKKHIFSERVNNFPSTMAKPFVNNTIGVLFLYCFKFVVI